MFFSDIVYIYNITCILHLCMLHPYTFTQSFTIRELFNKNKDRYIMFLLNITWLGKYKGLQSKCVYVFWSPEKSFIAQKMVISLFLEFLWEVENICTVSVFFIKHKNVLMYTFLIHHCDLPVIFLLYRHGGPPAPPRRTGEFMTIGLTCIKKIKTSTYFP